jgi:hypothetical protein
VVAREADFEPDPELLTLPAPPRQERSFTVAMMGLTMLASAGVIFALRGEVGYVFSSSTPIELGDLVQATPTSSMANRYVRATGLLSGAQAIRYERPMEGDSFRLAPIASNPKVWVEIRVPEGMEGPRFTPPTSFVGRLVPLSQAGVRHSSLSRSVDKTNGAIPSDAWLLIDGSSPRASRWALALVGLLSYFIAWNAAGLVKLLRKIPVLPTVAFSPVSIECVTLAR